MAKKKTTVHPFFIITFILATVGGLTAGILFLKQDITAPTHAVEQTIDPSILSHATP